MENEIQYKSRTQIKKEYKEVKKLGVDLAKLSPSQLKLMNLPEELLQALEDAKAIKSPPAAKRHSQYIGSLIGAMDPEPLIATLKDLKAGKQLESESTIEIRNWLDKLLSKDNSAAEEFLNLYPDIERQRLRQLIKNSLKEIEAGKTGKERKSYKGLKKLVSKSIKE